MPLPLKLSDLADYGVPSSAIRGWIAAFERSARTSQQDFALTELQSLALSHPATWDTTRNLVVCGPTSSGKTLIAQALVAKTLAGSPRARVLYLVPLRALVTEKTEHFRNVLDPYQVVVPLCTDYPLSDLIIANDKWSVGVAVFDKVYRWLSEPDLLRNALLGSSAVVVDELQVLEQAERGEKLELILTFLLWCQRHVHSSGFVPPRIVALTSSEVVAQTMRDWLHATLVPETTTERPVPLFEGWVIPAGECRVFSDPISKTELTPDQYPTRVAAILKQTQHMTARPRRFVFQLVKKFLEQRLRVLIYVATQKEARELAEYLAQQLREVQPDLLMSESIEDQLAELDESPIVETLSNMLHARVGIHHGDMTYAERAIVEKGFLEHQEPPAIQVVVATPTLSMGINLPADVVILRDHHTFGGQFDLSATKLPTETWQNNRRPMTVLEYRNFAGRAGRYRGDSIADPFGLSLLLVDKRNVEESMYEIEELLHGQVQPLTSHMTAPRFGYHPHVLTLSSTTAELRLPVAHPQTPQERVVDVLLGSYAIHRYPDRKELLLSAATTACEDLARLRLIGRTALTGIGTVAANYYLSLPSIERLLGLTRELYGLWPEYRLELLYELSGLAEVDNEYPKGSDMPTPGSPERWNLQESFRGFFKQQVPPWMIRSGSRFAVLLNGTTKDRSLLSDETWTRLIRTLAAWEWLSGQQPKRMNESLAFPSVHLRQLQALGQRLASSVGALRNMWIQAAPSDGDWNAWNTVYRQLYLFELSLHYGLPIDIAVLPELVSHVTNERLSRKFYRQLWADVGEWRDGRALIGKPCPSPRTKPRLWDLVQEALRWWSSIDVATSSETPNTTAVPIKYALQELWESRYTWDLPPDRRGEGQAGTQKLDWQARAGVDHHLYQTILERTQQIISRYAANEDEGLRTVVSSTLGRSPLTLSLRSVAGAAPRLRSIQIGKEQVLAALIPDAPTPTSVGQFSRKHTQLLVISPVAAAPSLLATHFQRKVRLCITLQALVAGSELVQSQPKHLQRFLRVLLTRGLNISSPDDLFEQMFTAGED